MPKPRPLRTEQRQDLLEGTRGNRNYLCRTGAARAKSVFLSVDEGSSAETLFHGAVRLQTMMLSSVLLDANRLQPVKVSCEYPKADAPQMSRQARVERRVK